MILSHLEKVMKQKVLHQYVAKALSFLFELAAIMAAILQCWLLLGP
jgi:hypothetical protein